MFRNQKFNSMNRLFFLLVCLLVSAVIKAQSESNISISGKIIDGKTQTPLSFVDVLLYQVSDTVLVKHDMSDEKGNFRFENISPGSYYVKARLLGYQDKKSADFDITNTSVNLNEIILDGDAVALQEVTVTTKKQFVEQHADRMIINPEATITTASDNVLDILAKSPGIVVDKDGNITLKGKSGITILIDDKPTYLSTEQLAAMLKNLQATSVEKIEIMENPPAKYDAEGNSGIINIKTKRGTIRGFNGSASLGAQVGEKWRGNASVDLNYRNEKWNIFGGFWTGFNNNTYILDFTRKFPEGDNSTFYESSEGGGHNTYNGIKIGADYYLNKDQIIGIMGKGSGWKWTGNQNTTTNIFDASGSKQRTEYTTNDEDENGSELTLNLNYRWTIDTAGKSLSADLDYAYYKYKSLSEMNTDYIPVANPLTNQNNQSSYTSIYSIKADYEHPFNEKSKLEAGFKSSLVNIDSEINYKQFDYSTQGWDDPNKMSNRFKYSENINALYASFKHKWSNKFDIQLGLRGEHTYSKGNNVTIDSINNQNYFNLFPTVFLQETFSEKHQTNFSYSYRIGRPSYWYLNPFVWMMNPYTYFQGNPMLQPNFSHSIKLSYTYAQKYILSLGYAYTKGDYNQIFEQNDATKITVVTWRNLSNINNADATLTIPVEIKKWCQINANMTAFYNQYKLPLSGEMLEHSKVTFRGNMNVSFSLPKDWTIELSGWYMSKAIYSMFDFDPMGSVDAGIQKQFLNKKLSLKLSVSDIFKTQKQNYTSKYQNIDVTGYQEYDSRRLRFNLIWRFGKDNVKPARQRTTGLEEEAGRTGK